jgi:hypothetical protein
MLADNNYSLIKAQGHNTLFNMLQYDCFDYIRK